MKKWLILLFVVSLNARAIEIDPFRSTVNKPHQVKILNHGLASLEERLQMIEKAKKSIDVEYFIYNLDKSGRIFSQALIKKAHEGIKVRMLLDYFMVKSQFSPFFAHEMEKHGIEVKYFNTTSTLNLFSGQYRNHRKVLLIDGLEAVTGGRNIGDEYFDLSEKFNFLDRDIKITGAIVEDIQETFNQVWDSKFSEKVDRQREPKATDAFYSRTKGGNDLARYRQDLKGWNKKITDAKEFLSVSNDSFVEVVRTKGKEELGKEYEGTCENMTYQSEYPIIGKKNRSERIIKYDLAERIKNAKESIVFDSPYFIVDNQSKGALESALQNNVKVKLLTNSLNSTDAIYVYTVFDTIIKKWINMGLETHIFKGEIPENYGSLTEEISKARFGVHAKSFVFDNKDVIIGTYNFDPRSANFNTEMTVSCDNNPELAKIVLDDIDGRIKGSIHLDSDETVDEAQFYNTGFMKRLSYYAFKIPSNLLDYLL
ncbi:MAG: phosphatidylserine/phosphatidylglycerophosphate/cardiolipin synthase family protein [Alphaproteobacteria bacterium]|nr:MAG: phosphatidylserine/phosphatidylglycerophosphate/cardiolipin synthase family protein [Alphaproteobacteria bacterium]